MFGGWGYVRRLRVTRGGRGIAPRADGARCQKPGQTGGGPGNAVRWRRGGAAGAPAQGVWPEGCRLGAGSLPRRLARLPARPTPIQTGATTRPPPTHPASSAPPHPPRPPPQHDVRRAAGAAPHDGDLLQHHALRARLQHQQQGAGPPPRGPPARRTAARGPRGAARGPARAVDRPGGSLDSGSILRHRCRRGPQAAHWSAAELVQFLRPPPTPPPPTPLLPPFCTRAQVIEPIQSRCAIVRFTRVTDVQMLARLKQVTIRRAGAPPRGARARAPAAMSGGAQLRSPSLLRLPFPSRAAPLSPPLARDHHPLATLQTRPHSLLPPGGWMVGVTRTSASGPPFPPQKNLHPSPPPMLKRTRNPPRWSRRRA